MIVYLAVNRINKKAYVGHTRFGLEKRVRDHVTKSRADYKHRSLFQAAIGKHGIDSFDFAVLQHCDTKESTCTAERQWIQTIGCLYPIGYNLQAGGEGSMGGLRAGFRSEKWFEAVRSLSVRNRHSDRMKALRAALTPEQREAWRQNAAAARSMVPVSDNMRGSLNPACRPDVREKIRQSKLGRPRPDMAQRWKDPEFRKRLLNNLRNRPKDLS